MNSREPYAVSRGQFVSLGAVILSLLIIVGVSVAYVGLSGQQESDNTITPNQDIEESTLSVARSASDVFVTTNQDPTISDYEAREDAVNNSIRQYVGSFNKSNSGVYGTVDYKIRKTYTGYMVSQTDPSANLTANDGGNVEYNWTAFTDARDARQAVMILNRSTIPPDYFPNKYKVGVSINDKTDLFVSMDRTNDNTVYLNTTDPSDESCSVKSVEDDRVKIDFLRGEINGVTCGDIRIDSAVNKLTVYSGSKGLYDPSGTFSTIYQDPDGDDVTSDVDKEKILAGYGEADTPEQTDVVYAVVMDVRVVEMGSSITRPVIISPGKHQNPLG